MAFKKVPPERGATEKVLAYFIATDEIIRETDDPSHIRSAPYLPMTQGEIELHHGSRKNVVKLENYYPPWHVEQAVGDFVTHCQQQRYHESLGNVTPVEM